MVLSARIQRSALREIEAICNYLDTQSKTAADKFLDAFEAQLNHLCQGTVSYPLSRMPELAKLGYSSVPFGKYIMLFYIQDDLLIVAHVLRGRQNYAHLV
jgi:plasmid stabilization system protein ParE